MSGNTRRTALLPAVLTIALGGCVQAVSAQAETAAARRDAVVVKTIEHRGVEGAVELSAAQTRVVVVPAWAARLSVLDFGTGNLLWNDPRADGKVARPADAWVPWDGNATDYVRMDDAKRSSQFKGLWVHPYPDLTLLKGGVQAASAVSEDAQLSVEKRYELSPDGRTLRYTVTITNHAGVPAQWVVQERALMQPGEGYVLLPLGPGDAAMPQGWAERDGKTVDPARKASAAGEFLVLRSGVEKGAGLAVRLRAGWIALVRDGGALLMSFPLDEQGAYPAYHGAHALPWLNPDNIEIEPLSPRYTLGPGRSASFAQVWHWLALPDGLERDDPQAVGRWLEEQAAATR